jgi:CheY-like chemotaxis protein
MMTRILLVEDNEANADVLSRLLSRRGFSVVVAVDGLQAIDAARREQPDLILMDMSLPEIDGWEATRRLKADPRTTAIPVIALTAHAMSSDRERCLEAGCVAFETKPIDIVQLVATITGVLGVAQES